MFCEGGWSCAALTCPLQFFAANPYDVEGASFPRPASTATNFDPATTQTTSGKRRYPNPVFPWLRDSRRSRSRCWRQIKIQLWPLTRFDRCIVDGSFDDPINN